MRKGLGVRDLAAECRVVFSLATILLSLGQPHGVYYMYRLKRRYDATTYHIY
jgi:hypothetical protein